MLSRCGRMGKAADGRWYLVFFRRWRVNAHWLNAFKLAGALDNRVNLPTAFAANVRSLAFCLLAPIRENALYEAFKKTSRVFENLDWLVRDNALSVGSFIGLWHS
jgi:hypothetical protein